MTCRSGAGAAVGTHTTTMTSAGHRGTGAPGHQSGPPRACTGLAAGRRIDSPERDGGVSPPITMLRPLGGAVQHWWGRIPIRTGQSRRGAAGRMKVSIESADRRPISRRRVTPARGTATPRGRVIQLTPPPRSFLRGKGQGTSIRAVPGIAPGRHLSGQAALTTAAADAPRRDRASAAWRSVRFSANCRIDTSTSRAGDRAGRPGPRTGQRTGHRQTALQAHHGP